MNINYDKEFEKIKETINKENPPRLLLQACCAPCATACLLRLLDSFDITLYYANDNITDPAEWDKRLGELQKLVQIINNGEYEIRSLRPLNLIVQRHNPYRFFTAVSLEQEKEGGARCTRCFALRLGDAKAYAEQNGYDFFGTTLTVSPYKNSQLLNEIGSSLQTPTLQWLMSDFKKRGGYNESIRLSTKYGLYRQHYCGCAFSKLQITEGQLH